ncbi:DHA2 family efflux MFS transporter permease subunit [Microbacterium sp. C7(2022)]|uniref:DHA2 family efflux MFS transporter permease subunit n=1 Tax=Microbacterium sp. C7(2022) TaxID=2992759 RepID=UPI00237C04AC|nr:DHA2 family efflux MFS transporter permease subunit [Microbacterium sp. C7(2022)]
MSPIRSASPLMVALTVIVGTVLIGIDMTIVNIAIPQLTRDTGAPLTMIQWVVTGYTLALATVMPATAWAIARFGAKPVFLVSIGLFTAGSALVAASWSPESLIAFRVVQGIGGGFVMPASMTLALAATPGEQRGRIMAVLGLPVLIGPVLGPVVGGLLLDNLSWRWMFLINVPFGIASLLLGLRNLPKTPKGPALPLDVRGLLLLPPAMALLVLGTSFAGSSLLTAQVLLPVGIGLALIAFFIRHALRANAPLLDIRVLTQPFTGSAAIVLFLFTSGWGAGMLLVPLYWQVVRGESATTAGLFVAPAGLAAGIAIQISGRLIDRVAPLKVIGTGLTVATAATTALLLLMGTETPAWMLVALWTTVAAGAGFTIMPMSTVATRALDGPAIPAMATVLGVINYISSAICIAVVSVVLTWQLAARLPDLQGEGIGALLALDPDEFAVIAPQVAAAVQSALWVPVALMAAALITASVALWNARAPQNADTSETAPSTTSENA